MKSRSKIFSKIHFLVTLVHSSPENYFCKMWQVHPFWDFSKYFILVSSTKVDAPIHLSPALLFRASIRGDMNFLFSQNPIGFKRGFYFFFFFLMMFKSGFRTCIQSVILHFPTLIPPRAFNFKNWLQQYPCRKVGLAAQKRRNVQTHPFLQSLLFFVFFINASQFINQYPVIKTKKPCQK